MSNEENDIISSVVTAYETSKRNGKLDLRTQHVTCIVPNCKIKSAESDLTFFKIPIGEEKRQKWIVSIGLLPNEIINKHNYVCQRHFLKEQITWKNHLTRNAVPILNIVKRSSIDKKQYSSENLSRHLKSKMGNNNTTSKVIEISDSDNDDESPSQPKEKTKEAIVEALPCEKKSPVPPVNEDKFNIIIDSDDELDTPPKKSDQLEEHQETSKTYYPPEFINIESLNKIEPKTSTSQPQTSKVDKNVNIKSKPDKVIEKIDDVKIIELLDDPMEIEEIKDEKDKQASNVVTIKSKPDKVIEKIDDVKIIELLDDPMEIEEIKDEKDKQASNVVTIVPADEQKEEPEIIDLDQNDAIEFVEESKAKVTVLVTDLKFDENKEMSNTMNLEKMNVEELSKDYKNAKKDEVEVVMLDKNDVNNQDQAAPKIEEDDLKTMSSEALTTLVSEIIPKTATTDDLKYENNAAAEEQKIEEEVIDLDDSGDSDALADEKNEKTATLQELVKDLNLEGNKTNVRDSSVSQSANENNVKIIITDVPVQDAENIEAVDSIAEEHIVNLDNNIAAEAPSIEQNVNAENTEKSVNIEVGNSCAEEEVIDLDANDNETTKVPLHNNSENINQISENTKKDENVLPEKNIETELRDKSPDAAEPKQDEEEIICLDDNDTDDNKAEEKQPDYKIDLKLAIETEEKDNKDANNKVNNEQVTGEDQPSEVEMELDAFQTETDVIDLDLDNNDGEINIATQVNTEINMKEKQGTSDIESNLENMTLDNQSNHMETEVELEEQQVNNVEISVLSNKDNQVEKSNKIETESDGPAVVNKLDTKMDVDDMEANQTVDALVNQTVEDIVVNQTIEDIANNQIVANETVTKKKDVADNPLQECVNYHCCRTTSVTSLAPIFVLSFYRINKKLNKRQFVCEKCYDDCVAQYEQMTGDIIAHKPIVFKPKLQPDLIELSDSDDDDASGSAVRRKTPGSIKHLNCIEDNESNRNALGNLEDLIEKAFSQINIDLQLKKRTDIINRTIEKNEATSRALFNDIRELQKSADKMHFTLYQKYPNRIIKELPPIDLNKEDKLNLPPLGDISYPQIQVGKKYLAPRHAISGAWVECEALEAAPNHTSDVRKHGTHWKVMFCRRATKLVLSIKHIAYSVPPDVRLNVGTRVVAIFQQVPVPKQSFFPGTVGETLKDSNKYRYLIFFDDGYCQYVKHEHVRLICEVSTNVWEDIDGNPGTSRFIQEFLTQFYNRISRPMLLAKRGQKIVTEFNGIWKLSKVVDVDCNLIKMYIEKNQTFEWIYRGSSRFAPIFKHRQIGSDLQLNAINYHLKKRNEPYIEMTLDEISDPGYQSADNNRVAEITTDPKGLDHPTATRAVARKSTNQGSKNYMNSNNGAVNKAPVYLNNSVIVVDDDKMPKGKVTYYETTKRYSTTTYVAHKCSPACLVRVEDNLEPFNPIARPLLSGWERQICKYKSRKIAIYRAPCGRRLRTMLEVHRYLRLTDSPLNVECFDYDTTMHCLAEYTDLPQFIRNTDLSDGTEKMPISCCNYFDKTTPPTCTYSTNRIPTEGVNLNLDTDFLCACDCEDDCIDKTKCQCWQLTIKGACSINSSLTIDDIGYCFKRLLHPVPTGIYECNSRCKCKQNCLNRVVQHPLSVKLQVFKTTNRGWGLRTLHDIPKGSFICIYAGDLLTEQSSNELGAKEGDEYFAELDYIEAVEGLKEGYESDIPREEGDEEPEGERDDDFENSADSDDDDFTSKCKALDKKITTRSSTRFAKNQDSKKLNTTNRPPSTPITVPVTASAEDDDCITISDDEEVRAPVNFIPNTSYDDDTEVDSKYKSVRKLFGKDELGYVMDAKRTGNIGRYFNHSCNPNLFVQNVFVDTHDLRFPWVTFFSNTSIQAGTELTWNYNYDVGCVPGKVLYCQCDSSNCRGRLL